MCVRARHRNRHAEIDTQKDRKTDIATETEGVRGREIEREGGGVGAREIETKKDQRNPSTNRVRDSENRE